MTTLFGHSIRWEPLSLCLIEAITYFCAALLLLAFWAPGMGGEKIVIFSALFATSCAVISGASGLYQRAVWARTQRLLLRTAVAGILLLLVWPVLRALGPAAMDAHRLQILAGFAGTVLAIRLAFTVAERRGLLRRRIVAVGAPATLRRPGLRLSQDDAVEVVAAIDPAQGLAGLDPQRLRRQRVKAVVAVDPLAIPEELRRRCEDQGMPVLSELEFQEQHHACLDVESLPADWLQRTRTLRAGRIEAALHRLLDLAAGFVLLAVSLPLLLVTAIAIKLDSRGPVFYRQERIGRDGRPFMLVKFRSMRIDAEAAGRPLWASQGDPRVTRIGRIIRRARIDEIPQVFNVLMGDMAFVGPRPERPAFVEQLRGQIPHYDDRAVVKPGITGWAQVNYPYGASVEDARMKLAYDLYYVDRRSLFLDLLILVATVRVVLFQEGAR